MAERCGGVLDGTGAFTGPRDGALSLSRAARCTFGRGAAGDVVPPGAGAGAGAAGRPVVAAPPDAPEPVRDSVAEVAEDVGVTGAAGAAEVAEDAEVADVAEDAGVTGAAEVAAGPPLLRFSGAGVSRRAAVRWIGGRSGTPGRRAGSADWGAAAAGVVEASGVVAAFGVGPSCRVAVRCTGCRCGGSLGTEAGA
ncbi:hypothetical protein [Streptomyces sp. NPDC003247]|uniref:hypothetical protein n=1 Tax=Streptomyces sp. NPDC003247 TaxID=3364677 RepID=UPI0036A95337